MSRSSGIWRWGLAIAATMAASAASAQVCVAPADNLQFIGHTGSVTIDYDPSFPPPFPGTRSATFSSPPAPTNCLSSTIDAVNGIFQNKSVGKFQPEGDAAASAPALAPAALPDLLIVSWTPVNNDGAIKRVAIDTTVTFSLSRTMKATNFFNQDDIFLSGRSPAGSAPAKVGTTTIKLNDVFAAGTYRVKVTADHTFTPIFNAPYGGGLIWTFEPSDETPTVFPPPLLKETTTAIAGVSPSPVISGGSYTISGTVSVAAADAPVSGNLPGSVAITGDGAGCTDSTLSPAGTAGVYGFSCSIVSGAVGVKTLTASYTDSSATPAYEGSSATGSQDVTAAPAVSCDGFFAPVDRSPTVNRANAGRIIPLKWRCTKNNLPVTVLPTDFKVTSTACTTDAASSTLVDAIEEYAGQSGILYQGNGNWQFNWATPRSYAGSCRRTTVTFDGATISENFRFVR